MNGRRLKNMDGRRQITGDRASIMLCTASGKEWLPYLSPVAEERTGNPAEVGIEYASTASVGGNAIPTFPRFARKNEISGRDRDKICRHTSPIREWLPYLSPVAEERIGNPAEVGIEYASIASVGGDAIPTFPRFARKSEISGRSGKSGRDRDDKSGRDRDKICRHTSPIREWLPYLSPVAEERTGNPAEVGIEYASTASVGGNAIPTFPRIARKNEISGRSDKSGRDRDKICRHTSPIREWLPYLFHKSETSTLSGITYLSIASSTTFALL